MVYVYKSVWLVFWFICDALSRGVDNESSSFLIILFHFKVFQRRLILWVADIKKK